MKTLLSATRLWAIEPNALNDLQCLSVKNGLPLQHTRTVSVRNAVAVIPIHGVITARYDFLTFLLGGTALDVLAKDFQVALDNPEITSIVFDIDSPGGVALGPSEMADMIYNARGKKPLIAYTGRNCCSAAYWLASACDRIVAHTSALLGSIGVVTSVPVQEQPDSDGYKTIEIVSSNAKNKRPDPRTPEGISEIRKELDALEDQFISSIARYRNLSTEAVKSDFGGGGVMLGTAALAVRMADETASFEGLLQTLTSTRHQGVKHMSNDKEQPIDTPEPIKEKPPLPDNTAALAKARADGIAHENARIMAIENMALSGYENLVAKAKADPAMTAEMLAVQIIAAEKSKGGKYLDAMKSNEAELPKVSAISAPAMPEDTTPEAVAKTEWCKSDQIRKEFGSFEAYAAYKDAESKGLIRILSNKGGK